MWSVIISQYRGLVLHIPVRGLFILRLDDAGDLAKYLCTSLLFINGKPSRKVLLVVFMSVAIGGLDTLCCMYFN